MPLKGRREIILIQTSYSCLYDIVCSSIKVSFLSSAVASAEERERGRAYRDRA